MDYLKGIVLKLISTLLFAMMAALVRGLGRDVPLGQVVFFRSFFALVPVLVIYAWRRELRAAVVTRRPFGHLGRGSLGVAGMFSNFGALARLPLVEATAISFLAPLITVALSAILLKETVRLFRWSAVALGFAGVIIMLSPHLDPAAATLGAGAALGTALALLAAFLNAGAVVQTRRLTQSETTSSIVFYFSLTCTVAGLCTWPFGWIAPGPGQLTALIATGIIGGLSHIFLTESYRHAPASVVAPFDYTAMIWAFVIGYFAFGELPSLAVYAGSVIVAIAGLMVIFRERKLGVRPEHEAPEAASLRTP